MNTLRWAPYPGADVVAYKIYRSMIGFRGTIVSPASVNGLTLQLKMNGVSQQNLVFDGVTPVVDRINALLQGGNAYASANTPAYFYVRSGVRVAPGSIDVVSSTALSPLGITARMITEKSENELIATVPVGVDPNVMMECSDPDGACEDWYAISTVDHVGNESALTPYKQPTAYTGKLCVLEGIVTNLQGVRIPDVEVTATLVKYPQRFHKTPYITLDPITVLTGPDGRFSLALLQGAVVELTIPTVGFSRSIKIPEKPCDFLTDIHVDLSYRYPLEYR